LQPATVGYRDEPFCQRCLDTILAENARTGQELELAPREEWDRPWKETDFPPIPPYEYPPPVARSSPGDQEKPKERSKPVQATPYQRPPTSTYVPHRPFIERTKEPEQPTQEVIMSHPDTVTLPPVQEVVRQTEAPKRSTLDPSKI